MDTREPITRDQLERALRVVAEIVAAPGGVVYLPIFERLECELAAMDQADNAMDRARAMMRATPIRGRASRHAV